MKFNWLDSEKERYHRKAAGILKENGIDFLDVDRSKFGVREWNEETQRASEVVVYLTPYPYKLITAKKKRC